MYFTTGLLIADATAAFYAGIEFGLMLLRLGHKLDDWFSLGERNREQLGG